MACPYSRHLTIIMGMRFLRQALSLGSAERTHGPVRRHGPCILRLRRLRPRYLFGRRFLRFNATGSCLGWDLALRRLFFGSGFGRFCCFAFAWAPRCSRGRASFRHGLSLLAVCPHLCKGRAQNGGTAPLPWWATPIWNAVALILLRGLVAIFPLIVAERRRS